MFCILRFSIHHESKIIERRIDLVGASGSEPFLFCHQTPGDAQGTWADVSGHIPGSDFRLGWEIVLGSGMPAAANILDWHTEALIYEHVQSLETGSI